MRTFLAATAALATVLLVSPALAAAAPPCRLDPGKPKVDGEPWAQQTLNIKAAHRLATGRGVIVAVVDSGVDFGHPQLKGQGLALDLTKTGPADCQGHGTGVAGIIAARPLDQVPFVGVAPGSKVLSVKVAADQRSNSDLLLARGILEAVRRKARVINVSAQTPVDSPALRKAVATALKHDVVVVAAAGNVDPKETGKHVPVYPAQYPGVLSVGAVDGTGRVTEFTDPKTRISVVAPGAGITSTWPGKTWSFAYEGTSFAAPFVAGVAALVRSAHPRLTGPQVVRRIEQTASGSEGPDSGAGLIDPLQAVSASLPTDPVTPTPRAVPLPAQVATDDRPKVIALSVGAAALVAAVLAIAVGVVLPRGGRRRWTPGQPPR